MTVISITSSRTSPGATSLAAGLAIAASHRTEASLLVEADPKGGMMSLRFGLAPHPSLATFGTDTRNHYSHELLWKNTQELRGARCMPGPVDPRVASSWVEHTSQILAEKLDRTGSVVFVDLGYLEPNSHSVKVAAASNLTVVVTRPSIAEVQSMLFQVEQLKAEGANVALVTVGSRPHDPNEVAAVAGIPLLAVLPDDAVAASVLSGGDMPPKKFKRTQLWRIIDGIAASCLETWPVQPAQAEVVADDLADENDAEVPAAPVVATATPAAAVAVPPAPTATPPAPVAAAPVPPARPNPVPRPGTEQPVQADPAVEPIVNPMVTPSAPAAPGVVMSSAPAGWPEAEPVAAVPAPAVPPAPVSAPVVPQAPAVPAPPVPVAAAESAERILIPQIREDHTPGLGHTDPAQPIPATLVSADGSRCVLPNDRTLVLGRDTDNDISINDRLISRAHAHLRPTEMGWLFIDLGSTNGSLINGQRVSQTLLSPGDEITLGSTSIVFSPSARILESA